MYNINLPTAGAQGFLSYLEMGGGTRLSPKKWPFFKSGGTKGGTELSFPKKLVVTGCKNPISKQYTVGPRYTVPRYTVFLDIPCTELFPKIPCFADYLDILIYRAPRSTVYRGLPIL